MRQSVQTAGTPVLHVGEEVGRYAVIELLGGGGMAEVFLAHDTSLSNREVALKSLRLPRSSSEHRALCQRLQRETGALARCKHPNVVHIYGADVDNEGDPYLVMERLRGESLEARLQRVGRLPQEAVIALGLAMLGALAHLHGRGVVHRDVTCSNIMLALDEEGCEVPKLIDFGLSWRDGGEGPTLTGTGQVLGTPRFMAPEQARGERADARADLYALGVVLYRALTGAWPYDDVAEGAWQAAQRAGLPVVALAARKVAVGAALAAVVHKALEGESERRFASASEMAAALERAVASDSEFTLASLENATLPILLDRYRLERPIGAGGMGKVYEAYTQLGKRVAIKTLGASASADQLLEARFEREGTIAAQLEHENIVSVWYSGKVGAVRFLVMEFLEGESLRERLERGGPLSLRETANVMLPICAAVDHMHQRSVFHRDLKPSNVMLVRRSGGFTPKLIDFGIAKAMLPLEREDTDVDTRPGQALGTRWYMAPEVRFSAQEASPASDVYALGVTLHECLTKRLPFDPGQKLRATPLAQRGVEVPMEVARVVDRALAIDAAERPTAAQLADCLAPYADEFVRRQWEARPGRTAPLAPPAQSEQGLDRAEFRTDAAAPVDAGALAEPSAVPPAGRDDPSESKTFAVEVVSAPPIGGAAPRRRRSWGSWAGGGILAVAAGMLLVARGCWGVPTDGGARSLDETQGALVVPTETQREDAGRGVPRDATSRGESSTATEVDAPPPTEGSVSLSPTTRTGSAVPSPSPPVASPGVAAMPRSPTTARSNSRDAGARQPLAVVNISASGSDAAVLADVPPPNAPATAAQDSGPVPGSQPSASEVDPGVARGGWRRGRGNPRSASDGSAGGAQ